MRTILLFLAVSFPVFGQTPFIRMLADDAAEHLTKKDAPQYPQLAQQTRITGRVILEIRIDEAGKPSVRRIISGHPILQNAAMDAVSGWRYQPFEADGKPVEVITLVMVPFGINGSQEAEGRAEMLFQHNFWTSMDSAQAALGRSDYSGAAQLLQRARDILTPVSDGARNIPERSRWMTTMAQLYMAQKKYDESEQHHKNALKLLQQHDHKDMSLIAATHANLASLYVEEKKYGLAREQALEAVAIYKKNFKNSGSGGQDRQETYGTAIAYLSSMLSKIATEQNDQMEAGKQCRTVLEFEGFLASTDHDSIVSACHQTVSEPPSKK